MKTLIVWLAIAVTSFGQLTYPKEVDPYEPLVITCEIKSGKDTDVQISWRASTERVKYRANAANSELNVWSPPGEHWLEATVVQQSYREIVVWIPDPAFPNDLSKAKTEKIKIALGLSINRYTAIFKVRGNVPPGPGPGPTPVVPDPSPALQSLLAPTKAIMARADPAKAAVWVSAWSDFAFAVQSAPPKSTGELKAALNAFMNAAAAKAGLAGAFPGFSASLETAFVAHFGAEDGTLDATKARQFVEAVVWACSPARAAYRSNSNFE